MDTLAYAKRLRDAGIPAEQAEAHAEAAREFIMAELVTKADLQQVAEGLHRDMEILRRDMDTIRREHDSALDRQTLRMTVRLGGMIAVGIALLASLIRLHSG